MRKTYILDTNIILSAPKSITGFNDNNVVITDTTVQELDAKKRTPGETGANAREACRILDSLRQKGDLIKGVKTDKDGKVRINLNNVRIENMPPGFDMNKADNRIISAAISISKGTTGQVILVTNDTLMRVSATICAKNAGSNLKVESYRNTEIETDYTGYTEADVSKEVIDDLYKNKLAQIPSGLELLENEFVTLHCGSQSGLAIARNGKLHPVKTQPLYGGIKPLNALQTCAVYALQAPAEEIPLVCLLGPAGTAKTFLSLAVGLGDTYASSVGADSRYYKMLVSRPNNLTSDPGIGYLPGDMNEKMEPLLAPLYDNMESFLMEKGNTDRRQVQTHVEDIFDSIIEITAMSYIRGRTLRNTYVICDEAQNASRTLIRDLITRAGEGTKIVLCGDPEQVDAPNLDSKNNGLVYAVEKMKGSPNCAIVRFGENQSVRSPLAKDAIIRMSNGAFNR